MSLRGIDCRRCILPTLLLVSFTLNLQLLDRFPLREDEALYSYWALSLRHEDFLMRTVWPDKPPLYLWTQAAVFELLGPSQVSARLLNIGLTTATVAVVAATGRRLWGPRAGITSALLFVFNPFAISFAATAYTDPLLVFCGQIALYAALSGRAVAAGVGLAAAIMTKQQGVLYLPLVLFTLFQHSSYKGKAARHWLLGMVLVILPILYWDSLRWTVAPSPWDLSVRNYAPLTVVPMAQWWARLRQWGDLLWYVGASNWGWLGVALLIGASHLLRRRGMPPNIAFTRVTLPLIAWCGGYLLLHVVTSIQIWDRYLLPLVPLVVLLCTMILHGCVAPRAPVRALSSRPHGSGMAFRPDKAASFVLGMTVLTLILLPPAAKAANGAYPIGGDRGAYNGLVESVGWLQQREEQAVLYHQRLGWHYQFYLFEQLQTDLTELRWFANGVYLADNAAKIPYQRRFYIQPTWHTVDNLQLHLATRNLTLIERTHFGEMRLYEIINLPQLPCTWCRCTTTFAVPWPTHIAGGQSLMSPARSDQ